MDHVARTPVQLGQILRTCRKLRGLTQQQVAAKVGVKQSTVSAAERSSSDTSVATLYRLLSALGVELVLREPSGDSSPRVPGREW